VFCLLVVLVKLSLLAKWLARKIPLRKPNHREGIISIKLRQKRAYDCVGLLYSFVVLLHDICVFPRPSVIYFLLLWHDIAYLWWKFRKTPTNLTNFVNWASGTTLRPTCRRTIAVSSWRCLRGATTRSASCRATRSARACPASRVATSVGRTPADRRRTRRTSSAKETSPAIWSSSGRSVTVWRLLVAVMGNQLIRK